MNYDVAAFYVTIWLCDYIANCIIDITSPFDVWYSRNCDSILIEHRTCFILLYLIKLAWPCLHYYGIICPSHKVYLCVCLNHYQVVGETNHRIVKWIHWIKEIALVNWALQNWWTVWSITNSIPRVETMEWMVSSLLQKCFNIMLFCISHRYESLECSWANVGATVPRVYLLLLTITKLLVMNCMTWDYEWAGIDADLD